jgi:hypothetical protein
MKTIFSLLLVSLCVLVLAPSRAAADLTASLKEGSPDLRSVGPLAFAPDGVLFAADPRGAAIFAFATADTKKASGHDHLDVKDLHEKIAGLLGTSAREVIVEDLAVNPASGNAYLSVSRGRGPEAQPALVRVAAGGKVELVALEKMKFSKAALPDAPDAEAKDRRGGALRLESVTDMAYVDGNVILAGLSNEEFSSTLRSIRFPFSEVDKGTGVKIYHGAHGQFETNSPVRTFVPYDIEGEMHLLAAYTCTPLVKLPLKELKAGAHVQGTTIAELGNRNRPLDMIVYEKGGKDFLLLANSSRGIMKITTEGIDKAEGITERVEGGGKKGQAYETIDAWQGVHQLDRLDAEHALIVRRTDEGALHLETVHLP